MIAQTSTSDGIGNQNDWLHSSRKGQRQKTTKTTINHSNGEKAPLLWEKDIGLCYCGVFSMELVIKNSGCTHTESDNGGKQQKYQ